MKKKIRVIFEDGEEWETQREGTKEEIEAYYLGQIFNSALAHGQMRHKMVKAVKVEFLY